MNLSDQINQELSQGKTEGEIIKNLSEQGYDQKTINDSLHQIKIKNAVNTETQEDNLKMEQDNTPTPEYDQQNYSNQDYGGDYINQGYDQNYAQDQQTYANQGYDQGYNQAPEASYSSDSGRIIEISEKVFDEKIQKIHDKLSKLEEFKTLTQSKVDNFSQRINKIESTIDKLQAAILKKIGSYTDTLDNIQDEMSMMQNSFGKIVNQAVKGASKKPITKKKVSKK